MSYHDAITAAGSLLLIGVCAGAAWSDWAWQRIPNKLTYGGVCAGLVIAALTPGMPMGQSLGGTALGFASLFLFWHWGMIGGGDVKLAMVVGAFKGPSFLIYFFLYVFTLSLILVAVISVMRIGILRFIGFMLRNLFSVLFFRGFPKTPDELKDVRILFGLLSLLAVVICLVLDWQGYLQPILT